MFTGAHFVLFSKDADADRAFIRDVLGLDSIDAGGGWLIFALPPAELAVHPAGENGVRSEHGQHIFAPSLYLLCDDVAKAVAMLGDRGVKCADINEAEWGRHTTFALPSGGALGLYEPLHATAINA